ncbi:class GN sortase [Shewanella submarina]|uniref:Class GN sortase n=1 Tax=Shewanella submarina TaxID=2016376 RepID=A0ABV7GD15_9GAMM|nr:class GN sortase [Shewanella submarina]MCL1039025.1 class GN sortase [Shewanella submarina]
MNSVKLLAIAVILGGLALFIKGGYMQAKAHFAQFLVANAWQKTLEQGGEHKPWSWADTWPVARLFLHSGQKSSASLQHNDKGAKSLYVLAGAVGRTLAFGPGMLLSGAKPGEAGNTVIAGHRDTHFASLQYLKPGQVLSMQIPSGETIEYQVFDAGVYHESDAWLMEDTDRSILTLITCYPFDALFANTPHRYVVRASLRQTIEKS